MRAAGAVAGQEVQALRQELEEIRRGTADASTVLAIQERLDRVQQMASRMASRQDTALALVLTSAQLRQAVDQGNPYEAELRTVRAIADEMPKVSLPDDGVLQAYADKGIPTREMLNERFDRLSADIIRAAAAPDDAPAWVQKTVQRVMGLVTVRRTDGEAVGDSAPAVVARADSALNAGNLQGRTCGTVQVGRRGRRRRARLDRCRTGASRRRGCRFRSDGRSSGPLCRHRAWRRPRRRWQ